jgi:mannose-6-phosphate isomerase-like protein (cupin superfamily)
MDIVNRATAKPFITKDGSEIRELLAYRNSVIRNQSLAEATIAPGAATQEHYHPKSEEIYYILRGAGRMKLDGELRDVGPLDAIAIPPGARHKIWNTGPDPLVLLCCCAPAYENDDKVMVE